MRRIGLVLALSLLLGPLVTEAQQTAQVCREDVVFVGEGNT